MSDYCDIVSARANRSTGSVRCPACGAGLASLLALYGHSKAHMKPSRAERFWRLVDRSGECWTWQGSHDAKGYGLTGLGLISRAHRMSWALAFGVLPNEAHVLHKCDNPPCVRPDHLFLGNNSVNQLDAFAKGRQTNVGTSNPRARLTEDDVRAIRSRRAAGETTIALGREFGVTTTAISAITLRQLWRHVA